MKYFVSMTVQAVDVNNELVTKSLETDVHKATVDEKELYLIVKEVLAIEMGVDYDNVNVIFFYCSKEP